MKSLHHPVLSRTWRWSASLVVPARSVFSLTAVLFAVSCQNTPDVVPTSPPEASGDTTASVATPTLDWMNADPWDSGTFDKPVNVYLATSTPLAEIHYTLDGTYPTATSPKPGPGGILVDSTRTLKAIATKTGRTPSALFQKAFQIRPKPAALVSLDVQEWKAFTYDRPVTVRLESPSPHSVIHYTLDGSDPDARSPILPSSGLTIDTSSFLRTVVVAGKGVSLDSNFEQPFSLRVQTVEIKGPSHAYILWPVDEKYRRAPFKVGMSCPTKGTVIHYTTDGTTPTRDSPIYSDSILFDKYADTITYAAIAFDTLHRKVGPSIFVNRVSLGNSLPWNKTATYGTLIDSRDGKRYRTIRIGPQNWMAENLDFATAGSLCYDNDSLNCTWFGRLYSWASAMGPGPYDDTASTKGHQGICPTGWHVPRFEEWQKLIDSTNSPNRLSSRLEARGLWSAGRGTDSTGFRALPTGQYTDAGFTDLKTAVYFWTATGGTERNAVYWTFFQSSGPDYAVYSSNFSLGSYSIRCIEN